MNLKVLVVFGGVSVEHEVSILSAIQVMSAMPLSYDVLPLRKMERCIMMNVYVI